MASVSQNQTFLRAMTTPLADDIGTSAVATGGVSPANTSSEELKEKVQVNNKEVPGPSNTAYQLPPNAGGEDDDAFANEPSVFDDAELAKFYWPRKDYEGFHRFFPDFKWTVGEEKRYFYN